MADNSYDKLEHKDKLAIDGSATFSPESRSESWDISS
jgi:hypothetical protein